MNYNDSVKYLNTLYKSGSKPGLSRIISLLKKIQNPQNELKIINVCGTNGKGSTSNMLRNILTKSGIKTGLFTSPSIDKINHSYMIDDSFISDEEFSSIASYLKDIIEQSTDETPTGFEFETALALEYFKQNKCDIVILEAGMGGKKDATNIASSPLLSIICDVSFDHESYLGETISMIAKEKAGIIKPSCPVLFGGKNKEALDIIKYVAKENSSPLTLTDPMRISDISFSLDKTDFTFDFLGDKTKFSMSLLGEYQITNALCALTAAEEINKLGFSISKEAAKSGIKSTTWKGRFEILDPSLPIIYDGAHNPQGMEMCVKSLKRYFGEKKVNIVIGVMADKNYDAMLKILSPHVNHAFVITPNNPRALSQNELLSILKKYNIKASACSDISISVSEAKKHSKENAVPLIILGSLYMYRDVILV